MIDQHKKIIGHRDLSKDEIYLINEIKDAGISLEVITHGLLMHDGIRFQ